MSTVCALCGKKLSPFTREPLPCGDQQELFCSKCYDRVFDLSPLRRAHLLLSEGHPADPDGLRQALDDQQARQTARRTGKTCLRCGGEMLRRGEYQLKLGEETFFFSDLNRLISGSMTVEVLCCEQCGKLEFFAPEIPGQP